MTAPRQFAILRRLPLELDWTEIDASAIQNMVYMGLGEGDIDIAFEPRILGVQWVRSYWQPGSDWGLCLYTAPNERAVQTWHDLCRVPFADIQEVEVEESAPAGSDYPRGFHSPPEAAPLVAVESPAGEDSSIWNGHIRTYRYPSGERVALYQRPPATEASSPPANSRPVVEIRPSDYL